MWCYCIKYNVNKYKIYSFKSLTTDGVLLGENKWP